MRLSKADRLASRPNVSRPDKNHVRIDFSHVLGRLWRIAASAVAPPKQADLFREVLGALDKKTATLDQEGTRRLLTHAVGALALWYTTIGIATVAKDYALEWQKEENRQQIELLKLPRLEASNSTELRKADREKIAHIIEHDLRRSANIITELSRDDPVLQFVSVQAEVVRPALFQVLEASGGGSINGVDFTVDGAAKTARRGRQNSRDGIGLWTTTTTPI